MSILRSVKRTVFGDLRRAFMGLHADLSATEDRVLMLSGAQAAIGLRSVDRVETLSDAGFRVTSQWDEDGILEWLLQHIPVSRPLFVEFGVSDYREANTRFLLRYRNWRGLVMDGSEELVDRIVNDGNAWKWDLTVKQAWITAANINELIGSAGFSGKIGVLSIDIDGNDYWVWKALDVVDPDIVICEYQGVYGDLLPIVTPYDEKFSRLASHLSELYYGASVQALVHLAEMKGYRLVGSNRVGNNAFFVRDDLYEHIAGRITIKEARPSLYREARGSDGSFSYVGGVARAALIDAMPVVRLDTGERASIGSLGQLYSPRWLAAMGA